MRIVAIIPARGGSKGVRNKNLREVDGVSLIGRAVRSAKQVKNIRNVYVSTDSFLISEEAERWGAEVVHRPDKLAGDEASSESAVIHAVKNIQPTDVVVFMQCTSPFTRSADIDRAVSLLVDGKYDSVFSATEDHGFRWELKGDSVTPVGHKAEERPRRQDLPPRFVETGAFYIFRPDGLINSGSRFHGEVGYGLTDKSLHIDIDSEADISWANSVAKILAKDAPKIRISALVMDFDGVQTDDYVWIDSEGRESVRVSRSDGLGISSLREAGLQLMILSSERNPVVAKRAEKLGISLKHGALEKSESLREWAEEHNLSLRSIAYLGNDVNDLSAMKLVGLPVAVSDAHPDVIRAASVVLQSKGGEKAVREMAEILLANYEKGSL